MRAFLRRFHVRRQPPGPPRSPFERPRHLTTEKSFWPPPGAADRPEETAARAVSRATRRPGVMNLRKELSLAACLLAILLSVVGAVPAHVSAQAAGGADAADYAAVADESFVIYQDAQGETVCRPATPAERERIRNASGTHVIYRGAPRRKVADGAGGEYLMQNSVEDSS